MLPTTILKSYLDNNKWGLSNSHFYIMETLYYLNLAFLSFCLVVAFIHFSDGIWSTKIFSTYIFVTFIVEIIGMYSLKFASIKHISIPIYNIYTLLEFLLFSLYFQNILQSKKIKSFIFFTIPVILLVLIVMITFELISQNKMFLITIIFYVIYSILYFRDLLYQEKNVFENPNFWIVTGILFFNAGFFFLTGFISYISSNNNILASKLFTINYLLNIIYYSLVTYGFICQRRLAKSSS